MPKSYPTQGQGSWGIYSPTPTHHLPRATFQSMSAQHFWPAPGSLAKRQPLGRELHPCVVGYHWYMLEQWTLRGCERALNTFAPPHELVSWLSSLSRLWPTSLVVCYIVGLLRLTKQRKTSWSRLSKGCWQSLCLMNKWTNVINLLVRKTHTWIKIWSWFARAIAI